VGIGVASVSHTFWLSMAARGSLSVAGWPVIINSGPMLDSYDLPLFSLPPAVTAISWLVD